MTVKLLALVLPLGLDTFGVALALGAAGYPPQRRARLSVWFATFEVAMPLAGVALGAPLGRAIGATADYIAIALLITLGTYMLIAGEHESPDRLLSMSRRGLIGAVALGVSISLDELTIGFSAGLLRLPIAATVIAIGIQAFLVTQVGLRVGARAGTKLPEAAEKLAGAAILALSLVLLIERLSS